jgi:hypothetical protein
MPRRRRSMPILPPGFAPDCVGPVEPTVGGVCGALPACREGLACSAQGCSSDSDPLPTGVILGTARLGAPVPAWEAAGIRCIGEDDAGYGPGRSMTSFPGLRLPPRVEPENLDMEPHALATPRSACCPDTCACLTGRSLAGPCITWLIPFHRPAIACAVAVLVLALLLSGCARTGEERTIAQCQRQSPPWLSAQCYELRLQRCAHSEGCQACLCRIIFQIQCFEGR